MMFVSFLLWSLVILLTYAGLACAIVANRPGYRWLAGLALIPVAATLLAGLLGPAPASLAIPIANGIGLAALAVIAGSPLVQLVLGLANGDTAPLGTHGGILVENTKKESGGERREILRGGATIGYLERLAVVGSLIAGQPAGVAVVVAVKGLGRFSELENEIARERFIIGTLASLMWAGACAAAIIAGW